MNTDNGIFINQITYSTANDPVSVIVSDVNSDQKLDIIVANYDSNNISLFLFVRDKRETKNMIN